MASRDDEYDKDHESAHEAAWKEGVERSRAVGRYLDALSQTRGKRGRKRTPESIRSRLQKIERELGTASGLARLRLMQEQKNLERELAALERRVDMAGLEADFVRHAKAFGEKEGIEYATWISFGVPRDVLSRAGVSPHGNQTTPLKALTKSATAAKKRR